MAQADVPLAVHEAAVVVWRFKSRPPLLGRYAASSSVLRISKRATARTIQWRLDRSGDKAALLVQEENVDAVLATHALCVAKCGGAVHVVVR